MKYIKKYSKYIFESSNNCCDSVYYHGSDVKFDIFDNDKQKIGWLGKGFYFTPDENLAKSYGKYVMSVYLDIKNPFYVKGNDPNAVIREIKEKFNIKNENFVNDISIILKENKYDGVVFNHWDIGNIVTCFDKKQIKII